MARFLFVFLVCATTIVGLVSAGCAPAQAIVQGPSSVYNQLAYTSALQVCNAATTWPPASLADGTSQAIYANCYIGSSGVCVDVCVITPQNACMQTKGCLLIPGRSTLLNCVDQNKLCGGLPNSTVCAAFGMCAWMSGRCQFSAPANPTIAPGESVDSKCPALHPVVIVMLVLMFLSFVGGVVVVAVVVIRNQKKADEEEARKEQAAAAAAEAKRARNARNKTTTL